MQLQRKVAEDSEQMGLQAYCKSHSMSSAATSLQVEFEVLPRQMPKPLRFDVRVDSSLREGSAIPAELAESLASEATSIAAEEGNTAIDVCLQMLPHVQEAAAKQFPGQVCVRLSYCSNC